MSLARNMVGHNDGVMRCLRCGVTVTPPADYCSRHTALGELIEAATWAERAIAPFSKEPAEQSGISRLRRAIARAEAESALA